MLFSQKLQKDKKRPEKNTEYATEQPKWLDLGYGGTCAKTAGVFKKSEGKK